MSGEGDVALRSVGRWDGAGGNSGASGPRVGLRRLADSAKQPQWRKSRKEAIEVARVSAGLRLIWVVKKDDTKQWVRPCGMAIATTETLVLPASQPLTFEVGES